MIQQFPIYLSKVAHLFCIRETLKGAGCQESECNYEVLMCNVATEI